MSVPPQHAGSDRVIHLGAKKRAAGVLLGMIAMLLRASRMREASPTRTVLILEPFGMGDMISYQPLIQILRENGYEVRICAREEWRLLYPEIQTWIPSRVPWSSYDEGKKYGLARYRSPEFQAFWRDLKAASDGVIGLDTRGDIRSVLFLYRAGCREVITLSNYLGSDLRNLTAAAKQVSFQPSLRRWQMNLLFLEPLGLKARAQPPQFPHLQRERPALTQRRLGLVPIAPWKGKLWGRARWSEFIANAAKTGWTVAALCGPGQTPSVAGEMGDRVSIIQCASIASWAEELQKFSAVVAVDTGPMHLADALGVPTIALFGQGLLPLWAPSGPRSRVVSHQDVPDFQVCHPVEENTHLGRECMLRIQPEEVLQALTDIQK
jgi:ADP-heptose:LPS heptosyltransferase